MRVTILAAMVMLLGGSSILDAQEMRSPYAGLEGRAIKALSAAEVDALTSGEGMGLALAAELNGYPGPKHVLQLADSLALSAEQTDRIRAVLGTMDSRAKELGAEIIRLEQMLDQAFDQHVITADSLTRLTSTIASLYGELRATHLEAHLEMDGVLTPHQVMVYEKLRGYEARHHDHPGAPH